RDMQRHVQRCPGQRWIQRHQAGNVGFHVRSSSAVEFAIRFGQLVRWERPLLAVVRLFVVGAMAGIGL
ncbi:hypothetical protein, partial [Pseudomonas syringae group genomosp. 7]|uniref:hypothetical protein n=1 Tax=Pseudomonas syringae group genomosp. 7 TaxID=251699 RepID=UPI00376FFC22